MATARQGAEVPTSWRMYVDGAWVSAGDGATYRIPNPATEVDVADVPDAKREDVIRAISAARRAFDEGPWRRTTPQDRRKILLAIADGLDRRKEDVRQILIQAGGAEWVTHGIQIDTPIELLRHYADLCASFPFEQPMPYRTVPTARGTVACNTMVVHQPVGVCGLIPTWNFPLFVSVQKLGPAIACGNTMVFKPSPWLPLVDLFLAQVLEECDLPEGVFNVVTGRSPEVGTALVESPEVDKISFTGSVTTGKRILESASRTLKRVHLELGGKSATLILEDADLDEAAMMASGPSFFHAGQGCALCTRVLVPQKKHDDLLARMAGFVQSMVRIGDPSDPGVMLGPVIRPERRAKVEEYIAAGREEGATLVTGGGRPRDLLKGWFLEPTIFGDVRNDMRIAREEIFGPVVSVLPYRDEEEAIRIANDSSYGLGGAILTRDTARGIEIGKRIRTGTLGINGGFNVFGPFGGFKESGIGREGGAWALHEYSEVQCISWT